jgi:proteasome assembly chaperone (PAC2) family protein
VTEFDGLPVLRSPVAIAAFEGWNDAADASTAVVEHLEQVWDARPVTALDPEEFYDFQVSRPTVTLADGETRRIEWPSTKFLAASPPGSERDVVLIRGIEPSMRWRTFCEQVLEVCHNLEVSRVVLLGALLADVPYTRPLPISGSASDRDAARKYQLTPTRYDGPTGIVGVLHDAFRTAGIPSVSLWAAVPHYVSMTPSPRAAKALCDRLATLLETPVDTSELGTASEAYMDQVSEAVAADDDTAAYVDELESRVDEEEAETELPSGDALAAELTRFLRDREQDDGGDSRGSRGEGS